MRPTTRRLSGSSSAASSVARRSGRTRLPASSGPPRWPSSSATAVSQRSERSTTSALVAWRACSTAVVAGSGGQELVHPGEHGAPGPMSRLVSAHGEPARRWRGRRAAAPPGKPKGSRSRGCRAGRRRERVWRPDRARRRRRPDRARRRERVMAAGGRSGSAAATGTAAAARSGSAAGTGRRRRPDRARRRPAARRLRADHPTGAPVSPRPPPPGPPWRNRRSSSLRPWATTNSPTTLAVVICPPSLGPGLWPPASGIPRPR